MKKLWLIFSLSFAITLGLFWRRSSGDSVTRESPAATSRPEPEAGRSTLAELGAPTTTRQVAHLATDGSKESAGESSRPPHLYGLVTDVDGPLKSGAISIINEVGRAASVHDLSAGRFDIEMPSIAREEGVYVSISDYQSTIWTGVVVTGRENHVTVVSTAQSQITGEVFVPAASADDEWYLAVSAQTESTSDSLGGFDGAVGPVGTLRWAPVAPRFRYTEGPVSLTALSTERGARSLGHATFPSLAAFEEAIPGGIALEAFSATLVLGEEYSQGIDSLVLQSRECRIARYLCQTGRKTQATLQIPFGEYVVTALTDGERAYVGDVAVADQEYSRIEWLGAALGESPLIVELTDHRGGPAEGVLVAFGIAGEGRRWMHQNVAQSYTNSEGRVTLYELMNREYIIYLFDERSKQTHPLGVVDVGATGHFRATVPPLRDVAIALVPTLDSPKVVASGSAQILVSFDRGETWSRSRSGSIGSQVDLRTARFDASASLHVALIGPNWVGLSGLVAPHQARVKVTPVATRAVRLQLECPPPCDSLDWNLFVAPPSMQHGVRPPWSSYRTLGSAPIEVTVEERSDEVLVQVISASGDDVVFSEVQLVEPEMSPRLPANACAGYR